MFGEKLFRLLNVQSRHMQITYLAIRFLLVAVLGTVAPSFQVLSFFAQDLHLPFFNFSLV